MYTQDDYNVVCRMLKKRWWLTALPAALLLIAAVAVFVYGQLNRNDVLWKLTVLLTVIGGGYFLFLYGVYVRPVRIYRKHLTYMLNGRMRVTTGVFKSFSEDVSDREGLDCYAMLINVGGKDDPEDDRLFYYDVHKPAPEMPLGTMITVHSNDKMVSAIELA